MDPRIAYPSLLLMALATAPAARTQQAEGYVGTAECLSCHEKDVAAFRATAKGDLFLRHPRSEAERLGCEGCHGPGRSHAESGGEEPGGMISFSRDSRTPVAEQNAVCLTCHEQTGRLYWQAGGHEAADVACTSCHSVMRPQSERGSLRGPTVLETCAQCHQQRLAQQLRASRMPLWEQKMQCSSCHNPHGSPNDRMLVASSINETCYGCHAEKRGPFLWEHAPVVENCANCHEPHGSTKEKMLKVPKPRLCQQCHDPTQHPTRPYGPADTRFISGRQCANCHTMIHGSNHPSGHGFTR